MAHASPPAAGETKLVVTVHASVADISAHLLWKHVVRLS